jgi:hypothetical protein
MKDINGSQKEIGRGYLRFIEKSSRTSTCSPSHGLRTTMVQRHCDRWEKLPRMQEKAWPRPLLLPEWPLDGKFCKTQDMSKSSLLVLVSMAEDGVAMVKT